MQFNYLVLKFTIFLKLVGRGYWLRSKYARNISTVFLGGVGRDQVSFDFIYKSFYRSFFLKLRKEIIGMKSRFENSI